MSAKRYTKEFKAEAVAQVTERGYSVREVGVELTTVKELLGHKNLSMTLRYAHLSPAHKVKAVDVLHKALESKSTIRKLYSPA